MSTALEVAAEKQAAAAVEVCEALRLNGRVNPAKFYIYVQRARAFEALQRFAVVAEVARRKRDAAVVS